MCKSHFTVGEISRIFGAGESRIRRLVDKLDGEIPRVGGYRLVPREMLLIIAHHLPEREGEDKPEPGEVAAQ